MANGFYYHIMNMLHHYYNMLHLYAIFQYIYNHKFHIPYNVQSYNQYYHESNFRTYVLTRLQLLLHNCMLEELYMLHLNNYGYDTANDFFVHNLYTLFH